MIARIVFGAAAFIAAFDLWLVKPMSWELCFAWFCYLCVLKLIQ